MIAILQPTIPHYREIFFKKLSEQFEIQIFTLDNITNNKNNGLSISSLPTNKIFSFELFSVLFYNFVPLLNKRFDILILMGSVRHFSTWLILLLNIFLRKKIILFGHGISIAKYLQEEVKMPLIRLLMYKLSKHAIFYTQKEVEIWKNVYPNLTSISFNNTISDADILISNNYNDINYKKIYKDKYNIKSETVLIYCARFNTVDRKPFLLKNLMDSIGENYSLIVIGRGPYKPDFSDCENIFDFDEVYDIRIKNELFTIADYYFQPAWSGLSVVEALLYGLPVLTFERSEDLYQCVEYSNLINNYNSIISKSIIELKEKLNKISKTDYQRLSTNAKNYSSDNLSITDSVDKTSNFIKSILNN